MEFDRKIFSGYQEKQKFPLEESGVPLGTYLAGTIISPSHLAALNNTIELKTNFGYFSVVEELEIDKEIGEQIKKDFLNNPTENPHLQYKIDPKKLNQAKKSAKQFLGYIEENVKQQKYSAKEKKAITLLYRQKINEIINSIDLLLIAHEGIQTTDQYKKQIKSSQFQKLSESIFGKPEKEKFDYFYHHFVEEVNKYISNNDLNICNTARQLLAELQSQYQPDLQNIAKYQNLLPENHDSLQDKAIHYLQEVILSENKNRTVISCIKEYFSAKQVKKINSVQIQELFQNILRLYGCHDWATVMRLDDSKSICTNQKDKQIKIPQQMFLTEKRATQLAFHEIGVHVMRGKNGLEGEIKLAGIGLSDYDPFEEGWTNLHEKIIYNELDSLVYSKSYYLGLGLIYGLDNHPKRDFKDLFGLMSKYFFLKSKEIENNKKPKKSDSEQPVVETPKSINDRKNQAAQKSAANNAYNFCKRLFRGTPGNIPGLCLTKDIIYENGIILVLDLLNQYIKDRCQNDQSDENIHQETINFYQTAMFGKINLSNSTTSILKILKIIK